MRPWLSHLIGVLIVLGLLLPPHEAAAENEWSATLYAGTNSRSTLDGLITDSPHDFADSHIVALAVARDFAGLGPHLRFEAEGQIVKHFGDEHHWEFNAAIVPRWITFPWNRFLDTSLAAGAGLSYATEVPKVEVRDHPRTGSARFLGYLMAELAFSLPAVPHWSLVGRVHHRSGAWGLFDGVHGASNYLGLGVKYRF